MTNDHLVTSTCTNQPQRVTKHITCSFLHSRVALPQECRWHKTMDVLYIGHAYLFSVLWLVMTCFVRPARTARPNLVIFDENYINLLSQV